MSGLNVDGRHIRKGAADSVRQWVVDQGGTPPEGLQDIVDRISRAGSTPLVVAEDADILGVIELKDVVKTGIKERFAELRASGIRTVMITGDNPLDRGGHRSGGRGRRLPGRGHPRGQDGVDQG